MSLVINVHRSFPCAHACDDAIVNSGSGASSRASIVAMVCAINSRIASRIVAAMFASSGVAGGWLKPSPCSNQNRIDEYHGYGVPTAGRKRHRRQPRDNPVQEHTQD